MKLGYTLGYWGRRPPEHLDELLTEAVDLGYESIWTAEAYGSDAITPLAWWGAKFPTVRLGTAIVQLSARTPTGTAMAAMTLDHLSRGRFVLGLGVSGPQVVEGWYGDAYAKPLARTREYIEIIRKVLSREPVSHDGERYQLPRKDGTGLGKPLKSIVEPLRTDLPILLAAEGPKNVALAAEIADGWLAFLYSPHHHEELYAPSLAAGFAARTPDRTGRPFEIVANVPVVVNDDVEAAADQVRPVLALYIGGMGAKTANFHHEVAVRMGYDKEAKEVQRLYLSGQKREAEAALPLSLIEQLALVGPPAKIADDLAVWKASPVDTLMVGGDAASMRAVAAAI